MSIFESFDLNKVNLYELFGVPKNAETRTIKEIYRKRVRELHSDKSIGKDLSIDQINENQIQFNILTEAYKILINPVSRRQYDSQYSLSLDELRSDFQSELETQRQDSINRYGYNEGVSVHPSYNISERVSIDEFNRRFENARALDPNDHGYAEEIGMSTERITSTSYNPNLNMSSQERISQHDFNRIFEERAKQKKADRQLIKSSDGPVGVSFDGTGASNISSFGGIMVVGGTEGGYTSSTGGFSDYKESFSDMPISSEITLDPSIGSASLRSTDFSKRLHEIQRDRSQIIEPAQRNRGEAEKELLEKRSADMQRELDRNKQFVKKYSSQFPTRLIEDAFSGVLESSGHRKDSHL